MRLLLFSDLHCDAQAAQRLVDEARDVDIVVGAGDFATCRRGIERTLDVLKAIDRPAVLVAGNAESVEELRQASQQWQSACVLHGTGTTINEIPFFGLGGAVPVTPFGSWSFDLTEDQARQLLHACPSRAVLVTHAPPQGAVDLSTRGVHLGSIAIRETIERTQPLLVVCGHIHDSAGQSEQIQQTPIVNVGPRGIIWDL